MMNATNRIELLDKSNYDTWKLRMQALLIKEDLWEHVSGISTKPEPGQNNENAAKVQEWTRKDLRARSDIILSIASSELKQVKQCETSRAMWKRLEEIYQSKGPARKATLLKTLILHKMADNGDVREHLNEFFDAVDKLNEMDVEINADLLTILVLYSLPSSFEIFRCAIESRDNLPTPEALRVKIIEESEARRSGAHDVSSSGAMFSRNSENREQRKKPTGSKNFGGKREGTFKIRCFKCNRPGHKAAECRSKNGSENVKCAKSVCLNTSSTRSESSNRSWCLDSGATSHLCNEIRYFRTINDSKRSTLNLANSATTKTMGEGTVEFTANVYGDTTNVSLSNTLHVPDLRTNLMSIGKITDRGLEVHFRKNDATILDSKGNIMLIANRVGDLYFVNENGQEVCATSSVSRNKEVTLELLHRRLGHANTKDISSAVREHVVRGVRLANTPEKFNCEICLQGKMSRSPFPRRSNRLNKVLDLVHTDVCGPMRTQSLGGAKYFIEFIDDASRWCEVRFLKSKAEVFKATTEYIALVENQKGKKVKCLQSDNGGEYTGKEFDDYLKKRGITRRLTAPYNPEQNGTAERKNRTLLDMARCLLKESNLPNSFWAEAVNTANHLRNRLPTKSLDGRTPYEVWTDKVPDISHFRVFGARVFYLDREPGRGKFDSRGQEGIFLGYADHSKAYRVWSTKGRKVVISRDVKFVEEIRPHSDVKTSDNRTDGDRSIPSPVRRFTEIEQHSTYDDKSPQTSGEEVEADVREEVEADVREEDVGEDVNDVDKTDESGDEGTSSTADRKNVPEHQARGPGRPRIVRAGRKGRPKKVFRPAPAEADPSEVESDEQTFLSEIPMKHAMAGHDAGEWRRAIAAEMKSVIRNDTWTLVDRPRGCKIVGSRIVLRNKFKPDGTLERRKARLVAQGFSQQPGIHFQETFAPVARFSSIRIMASLAARYGMKIRQFDVATAFLNGELKEEIYMEPPKGFRDILQRIIESEGDSLVGAKARSMLREYSRGNKVCFLKKSLYGLRQAGRSWYLKLDETLRHSGAVPTAADPCLFQIGSGEDATLIAIYVDDILIASRNQRKIAEISKVLSSKFEIKDLGDASFCLGVEFGRVDGRVTLHQRGYIKDMLARFGMSECKPVATPVEPGTKLIKKQRQSNEELRFPYRELLGSLTYLSTTTRPDISFAVSHLGQFNNCYGEDHWTAAKRVLRYLKGTVDLGLVYEPDSDPLTGFVDADWGSCTEDRRSFTGYIFLLNGGPVSWDSRKQRTVALSTTEAEYMALSEGVKEAIYLQRLLQELGADEMIGSVVFCDNKGSLRLAENPTFHARSKHIDIRHHFVRDVLRTKKVTLEHVPTDHQVADFLTKGLPKMKHSWCVESSGLSVM
jgi:transposase InsO family protein